MKYKTKIMTKTKLLLVLLMLGASFYASAQKKDNVTIKGILTGDLKGHNLMYMYNRMGQDSAQIKDGHYELSFHFESPEMKMLLPEYITAMHQMYQPFGILITGPGTYYVKSDISEGLAKSSMVSGVQDAVIYRQFEQDQRTATLSSNEILSDLYGDKWYMIEESNPKFAAYSNSRDSLETIYTFPVLKELVKKHPNSLASAFVLANAGKRLASQTQQENLYGMLSSKMQNSPEGQIFYDFIQGRKNSAMGGQMIKFSLPDQADQLISSTKFKGKYLLVDFWASWCAPCRQSFPHMRALYKDYKDKNFEILSISIDQNKEAWLKAVGEENNPWPQVLDTKNVSQKGFAVNAVPNAFLISPEGKIIAKQIGFDPEGGDNPIESKMAEVLGERKSEAEKGKQPATKKKVIKAIPMTSMQ